MVASASSYCLLEGGLGGRPLLPLEVDVAHDEPGLGEFVVRELGGLQGLEQPLGFVGVLGLDQGLDVLQLLVDRLTQARGAVHLAGLGRRLLFGAGVCREKQQRDRDEPGPRAGQE